MRLHDLDRVGKLGPVRIFSSLFKFMFFNFLLFQFSTIFSLHEKSWKSVYGNGIFCLKAVKFA